MTILTLRPDTLDRQVRAVERVRERLLRAASALEAKNVLYAVVGGNAVGGWVAQIDETFVRQTRDIDILIRREDLEAVKSAMTKVGFEYAETSGIHLFIDGPTGKPSEGVRLLFAGEKGVPEYPLPNPDVTESLPGELFRIVELEPLVRMKLLSNRDKDRTHIRDLIGVGLIDASWPQRFIPGLAARLQGMLDTPNG